MRRRETKVLELLAHNHRLDQLEETVESLEKLKNSLVKTREIGGQHGRTH
jgi:F0F1-type ATP synthase delta subunit